MLYGTKNGRMQLAAANITAKMPAGCMQRMHAVNACSAIHPCQAHTKERPKVYGSNQADYSVPNIHKQPHAMQMQPSTQESSSGTRQHNPSTPTGQHTTEVSPVEHPILQVGTLAQHTTCCHPNIVTVMI
jgi:hypothetical protein